MSRRSGHIQHGDQVVPLAASLTAPIPSTGFVFKYLESSTASSGNEMAMDASSSGDWTPFTAGPSTGQRWYVHRVNWQFQVSSGNTNISPSKLGVTTGATNGILIDVYNAATSSQQIDFLDGRAITSNAQFANLAGVDLNILNDTPVDDGYYVRWTITEAGAALELSSGEVVRVQIRDDLSDMRSITAMVQGLVVASDRT